MERISKFRAGALLAVFIVILVLFCMKLYSLQIIETNGKTDNTTTYTTMTRVKAARGDILDRNGNVLVGNRASYDLVFNHYVAISSDNTNDSLRRLIDKCEELGIEYNDHFPVTKTHPFEYTLDEYSSTWRKHFQSFLGPKWCDLDSDITAPLLIQKLRSVYDIPEDFTDTQARAVIGLRYELDLRNVTNLSSFVFISDVSSDNLSTLLELDIPGLMVEASTVREYYTKYAAHILGTVGAMDDEDWAIYKEKGYAMDAYIGQSGFEEAFEEYLHAEDGTRIDVVSRDGTIISQYYANEYDENGNVIGLQEPKAGNNVETTIDLELQIAAEDALDALMKRLTDPTQNTGKGQDAQGAAAVVIDVKTGQVLACASYPTYDITLLSTKDGYKQIEEADFAPMYNRALLGTYAPGSSYKPVTLIAAYNNGHGNLSTLIKDEGVFTKYEGFAPECLWWTNWRVYHGGADPIDCIEALEGSCNYFFYVLGDECTIDELDETAKAMGLGEATGVELFENIGHRSNRESKAEQYTGTLKTFTAGDKVLTAIGQSENRFTPIQLAVYAATLANRGTRMKATFLNRVVSSDYTSLILENEPSVASTYTINEDAYQGYMQGMYQVVYGKNGTAKSYFGGPSDGLEGDTNGYWTLDVKVAAKTGTAETFKAFSSNGAFICFAPYDDPEVAVAVYGERVGGGSTMGIVAEEILRVYFAVGKGDEVAAYENQLG